MREFHAYRNEDGTYKLEVIVELYENDELKEAHVVWPKVSIVSDSLVIKASGDLFTVVVEE